MTAATPPAILVIEAEAGGAHPASDGAHRLGWWLAGQSADFLDLVGERRAVGVSGETLGRMVLGEVEPSETQAAAIEEWTHGAVKARDWLRGGSRCWCDQPIKRPER